MFWFICVNCHLPCHFVFVLSPLILLRSCMSTSLSHLKPNWGCCEGQKRVWAADWEMTSSLSVWCGSLHPCDGFGQCVGFESWNKGVLSFCCNDFDHELICLLWVPQVYGSIILNHFNISVPEIGWNWNPYILILFSKKLGPSVLVPSCKSRTFELRGFHQSAARWCSDSSIHTHLHQML